jgi:hypothetical protein
MTIQRDVFDSVAARGYLDESKWSREQLIVRQVLKAQEELGEAADDGLLAAGGCVAFLLVDMVHIGKQAGYVFDGERFKSLAIDGPALRSELADLQVVLFIAAELLGFDIVQAAAAKAQADVERGVR